MDFKSIGYHLLARRNELGMSQQKLAELSGCRSNVISEIEHGAIPYLNDFILLCRTLEIPTDFALQDIDKQYLIFSIDYYCQKLNKQDAIDTLKNIMDLLEDNNDR